MYTEHSPAPAPNPFIVEEPVEVAPAPTEPFSNINVRSVSLDSVLKAIFFGTIFYLLSLPELYKMTKKCCKKVDGVLLHSVVFAVLYFVLSLVI